MTDCDGKLRTVDDRVSAIVALRKEVTQLTARISSVELHQSTHCPTRQDFEKQYPVDPRLSKI